MPTSNTDVVAPLAYLVPGDSRAQHLIYPPNCARALVRPAQEHHAMPIADCRQLSPTPTCIVALAYAIRCTPPTSHIAPTDTCSKPVFPNELLRHRDVRHGRRRLAPY